MDPLGDLKNLISRGLSNVEQWGSDIGNDATKVVGNLFNTSPPPTSPSTQLSTLANHNITNPTNPALTQGITQTNQQSEVPAQSPNTITPPPTPAPVAAPKPMQTNLVNYQQPVNITPAQPKVLQSASTPVDVASKQPQVSNPTQPSQGA